MRDLITATERIRIVPPIIFNKHKKKPKLRHDAKLIVVATGMFFIFFYIVSSIIPGGSA